MWKSYDNDLYAYSIKVPIDWETDTSDAAYVTFGSPDGYAGVTVEAYSYQAELGGWVAQTIRYAENVYSWRFDLYSETIDEKVDGTGSAFIIYIAQASLRSCVEHVKVLILVTRSGSYSLTSILCDEALLEYADIEKAILFEHFEVDWWNRLP